jgi:hypothetical protein
MTAYKLLVIISYFLRSCFAPTDIFACIEMHPVNQPNTTTQTKIGQLVLFFSSNFHQTSVNRQLSQVNPSLSNLSTVNCQLSTVKTID